MSHVDALILSALITSVWLNLYLSADRLVSEAKSHSVRPGRQGRLRWLRMCLATLQKLPKRR